ncbi:MAG TPA: ISKra4 family transposase [Streptosporangiaceae bacterium]|jgi:hypothetical protein
MEGYAVRHLVASAEGVQPGLGVLVGGLLSLVSELGGADAGGLTFDEIEQQVIVRGREVLRTALQQVLDVRAAGERRLAHVSGADGVVRTRAERGHARTVVSWFGPVVVRRMAYRTVGAGNLYPADGVLNLPVRRYSWQIQRAVVMYALAGSYEQAQLWLQAATGVSVGKQQLEQIVAGAARDAPGFCPVQPEAARPGLPLVISVDGKGVAMRPEALRAETARKARGRTRAFRSRLGTGQKAGHTRIAEVGVVFDVQPAPVARVPEQILGRGPGQARPAGPVALNRWYTAEITASRAQTIAKVFDQAERRDPGHDRPWIALADGDLHQIGVIRAEAAKRGITITILVDFIHVLEYLWKAAWCFHPSGDRAAEDWVTTQGLAILHGQAAEVITTIEALATTHPPSPGREHAKIIHRTLGYLRAKQPYLDYPTALASGWPIATGVIEGACRHLVADRMAITGARWSLPGAQAMLWIRAIHASGDLPTYWTHHIRQEHHRNHLSHYQTNLALAA